MDGGSSAPNARRQHTDDVVGANAQKRGANRQKAAKMHRRRRKHTETRRKQTETWRSHTKTRRKIIETGRKHTERRSKRQEQNTNHRDGANRKKRSRRWTRKPQCWREKGIKIWIAQGLTLLLTIAGRVVHPSEPTWLGETYTNLPPPTRPSDSCHPSH